MPEVVVENVHKSFGTVEVLKGVSLSVGRGEVFALIGRSGSGKSTLLRCMNGLEKINAGHIEIAGHASAEGGIKRNQELSVQRAQAVAAYLAKAGFDRKLLTAVGYGETRPLVPNDSDENLARNRRVELTVHGPKGRASLQGRN